MWDKISIACVIACVLMSPWTFRDPMRKAPKVAEEEEPDVVRCASCGRACLHGAYETENGWLCRGCGAGQKEDNWMEE